MSDPDSEEPELGNKRRWRADTVRLAVGILESEKDYRNLNVLGRGTYGDVFRMYDPARNSDIAVKIVTSDNIAEIELKMWPKLYHPNIVPLLELLVLDPLEVAIFVMPVQNKTLYDVLHDKHFLLQEGSLVYIKAWLYEVLCGLAYMKSKNLCHLDIKVDNVLITYTYTAMLCDFSFLNFTTKPLERYDLGLPYIYRPPEACHSLGDEMRVDGPAYDMWGYGMMVVEIFTRFVMATTVTNEKCWYKEVYPTLFKILQESHFKKLMTDTFLAESVTIAQIKLALNFIHSFLYSNYTKRTTPVQAMKHMFLNRGTDIGPVPDPVWIHKGAIKSVLKTIIQKSLDNEKDSEFYKGDLTSDLMGYSGDESEGAYDFSENESSGSSTEKENKNFFDRIQTSGNNITHLKSEDKVESDDHSSDWTSISDENQECSGGDFIKIKEISNQRENKKLSEINHKKKKMHQIIKLKDRKATPCNVLGDQNSVEMKNRNFGNRRSNGKSSNKANDRKVNDKIDCTREQELFQNEKIIDIKSNFVCSFDHLEGEERADKRFTTLSSSFDEKEETVLTEINSKLAGEFEKVLLEEKNTYPKCAWNYPCSEKNQTSFLAIKKSSNGLINQTDTDNKLRSNSRQDMSVRPKCSFNKLTKSNKELYEKISETSLDTSPISHIEALYTVKTLQDYLVEIDQKINELTNILVCENCSSQKISNCVKFPSTQIENDSLEVRDNKINGCKVKSEGFKTRIAKAEKLGNRETKIVNINILQADSMPPLNTNNEDEFFEMKSLSLSDNRVEKDRMNNKVLLVKEKKESNKTKINRRRKIVKWCQKKYFAFEKIINCMPYNLMK